MCITKNDTNNTNDTKSRGFVVRYNAIMVLPWGRESVDIMRFVKENWKFLILVLAGGLIGGYCAGIYLPDTFSEEVKMQMQEQNVTPQMVAIVTMLQYALLFGLVLAIIGGIIAEKVGLWKEFSLDKKAVTVTLVVTIVSGLILFPGDKLIFGSFSSLVNDTYNTAPGLAKIISGLLLGGIIEEVMMRLFLMSLMVFIFSKLFCRNKKEIPVMVYVIANVLSSLAFAAGHIPATKQMTELTAVILFRCFLLNGGFGMAFGYLYRKYGIGNAMFAHGFTHLIADTLQLIIM